MKQKMQTLSIDEYDKLKQSCIEKGQRFIPLYIGDKQRKIQIRNAKNI
jgi:hypothetical protein